MAATVPASEQFVFELTNPATGDVSSFIANRKQLRDWLKQVLSGDVVECPPATTLFAYYHEDDKTYRAIGFEKIEAAVAFAGDPTGLLTADLPDGFSIPRYDDDGRHLVALYCVRNSGGWPFQPRSTVSPPNRCTRH
jgi:hypothetical protein